MPSTLAEQAQGQRVLLLEQLISLAVMLQQVPQAATSLTTLQLPSTHNTQQQQMQFATSSSLSRASMINLLLLAAAQSAQAQNVPLTYILAKQNPGLLHTFIQDNVLRGQLERRLELLLLQRAMAANASAPGGNVAPSSQLLLQNTGRNNPTVSNLVAGSEAAMMPAARPLLVQSSQQSAARVSSLDTQMSPTKKSAAKPAGKKHSPGEDGDGPRNARERWGFRFQQLKRFHEDHGHCRVPHRYAENVKLAWWVMNQRAEYKRKEMGQRSWLTEDRVQKLDDLGFDWVLKRGKFCNKKKDKRGGKN